MIPLHPLAFAIFAAMPLQATLAAGAACVGLLLRSVESGEDATGAVAATVSRK